MSSRSPPTRTNDGLYPSPELFRSFSNSAFTITPTNFGHSTIAPQHTTHHGLLGVTDEAETARSFRSRVLHNDTVDKFTPFRVELLQWLIGGGRRKTSDKHFPELFRFQAIVLLLLLLNVNKFNDRKQSPTLSHLHLHMKHITQFPASSNRKQ